MNPAKLYSCCCMVLTLSNANFMLFPKATNQVDGKVDTQRLQLDSFGYPRESENGGHRSFRESVPINHESGYFNCLKNLLICRIWLKCVTEKPIDKKNPQIEKERASPTYTQNFNLPHLNRLNQSKPSDRFVNGVICQ
ncbi:hypothetical protein L1987_50434 [Smallanthus sonchifolius]|uniref:Uncharacterized protein n=1 Tax=Smallanthus sonchifolius TaxID=185202 RepID=A0ACB9EMU9_9ASTR|nr:hypothetical protein L1987_50434 [Smallanthus sonchifolius]